MKFIHLAKEARHFIGIEKNTTGHSEKIVSALGAFVGITGIFLATHFCAGLPGNFAHLELLIIASMGASAVLLFAVPHGALSQPWAVFGGHVISAFIGVACQKWLPSPLFAGGVAVGLAVLAMYYLRCIHPPGGATALTAVLSAEELGDLGFYFVVNPILLNVFLILFITVIFNLFFAWLRYPKHLTAKRAINQPILPANRESELTTEDFLAAIHDLGSFVDITEESLTELLELAKQNAEKNIVHPDVIAVDRYYSNGKLGNLWSIRQVIDASSDLPEHKNKVIYKVVAGKDAYETGITKTEDFRQWARFEVMLKNGRWVKVEPGSAGGSPA